MSAQNHFQSVLPTQMRMQTHFGSAPDVNDGKPFGQNDTGTLDAGAGVVMM